MFEAYKPAAGVAIAVLLILWQCWPAIQKVGLAIKTAWPASQPPQLATDAIEAGDAAAIEAAAALEDVLDFKAIARLDRRFERNKCTEGREAVKTALTCFYKRNEA